MNSSQKDKKSRAFEHSVSKKERMARQRERLQRRREFLEKLNKSMSCSTDTDSQVETNAGSNSELPVKDPWSIENGMLPEMKQVDRYLQRVVFIVEALRIEQSLGRQSPEWKKHTAGLTTRQVESEYRWLSTVLKDIRLSRKASNSQERD